MKRNKPIAFFLAVLVFVMMLNVSTTVVAETQGISSQDDSSETTADLDEDSSEDDSISEDSEDLNKQPTSSSSVSDDRDGLYADKAADPATDEEFSELNRYRRQLGAIIELDSFTNSKDMAAAKKAYNTATEMYNGRTATSKQVALAEADVEAQTYLRTGRYGFLGKQSGKHLGASLITGEIILTSDTGAECEWFFDRQFDGSYLIKHMDTDYYIAPVGDKLALFMGDHSKLQRWKMSFDTESDTNVSFIFTNMDTGKVMDVDKGGTEDGTLVCQYQFNNGPNQKFVLQRSETITPASYLEFSELDFKLKELKIIIDLDSFTVSQDKIDTKEVYETGLAIYNDKKSTFELIASAMRYIEEHTYVRTGRYNIIGNRSNRYVVPILNAESYDGGKVQLKSITAIDDEWYVERRRSDNSCLIKHVKSGYYLTASLPEGGVTFGLDLTVRPFITDERQRWVFRFDGFGTFMIYNRETINVMDIKKGETSEGAQVIQNYSNDNPHQRFRLERSTAAIAAGDEEFKALHKALNEADTILKINIFSSDEDKTALQYARNNGYNIFNNKNSTLQEVVSAKNALVAQNYLRTGRYRMLGKQSGKNIFPVIGGVDDGKVALFPNTTENSNEWYIELQPLGSYTLKYLENNLFLSVDPEKKYDNSRLTVRPYTDNLQQWEVSFDSNGSVMFSNVETEKYMSVSGGLTVAETPIIQAPNGNATNQKFILYNGNLDTPGTPQEYAELNTALARLKLILDLDFFVSDEDKEDTQKVYDEGLAVSKDTSAYVVQIYFARDAVGAGTYLRNGRYRFTGKQSEKHILPALNRVNYDNSKVKLASFATSADEWYFERVSDDTYVIQHMKSSYYLTPDPNTLDDTDCDLLVSPYTRTNMQRWGLDFSSDNTSFSFYNVSTEKYIDVYSNGTADGTRVVQFVRDNGANQNFVLSKSGGDLVASATEFSELNTALVHLKTIIDFDFFDSPAQKTMVQKIYDDGVKVFEQKESKSLQVYLAKEKALEQTYPRTGRYRITGFESNKNVVPTLNGADYNSGRVRLSGTADDLSDWFFERQQDGSYIIEHLRSGYCLTPVEGSSNSNLVTLPSNADSTQRWFILIADEANMFLFCNAETGKYMDVSGNSVEEGAQLIQFPFLNGKNQKFYLTKSNADALATPEEIEDLDDVIKRLKVIVDLDSFLTIKDEEAVQKSYNDAVAVYNNKKATAVLVAQTIQDTQAQTYLRSGRYSVVGRSSSKVIAPDFNAGQYEKGTIKLSSTTDTEDEWYFERLIDGTYLVEHVRSGYCLSPDPSKKNTDCNLLVVPFVYDRLLKWELTCERGSMFIFRNEDTKKYMDVDNNGTTDGTPISQRVYNGEANQEFFIQKSKLNEVASAKDFEKLNSAVERIKMIADFDMFFSSEDKGIVIEAHSDAKGVYDNKNSTAAQVSYATQAAITQAYIRDGEYDIVGKQSGKYILPISYDKGAIIVLNSKRGPSDNDGWDIERQVDGSYIIRHMQDSVRGNYLSVDPEDPSSETLIATSNVASGVQEWEIIFDDNNFLMFSNMYNKNHMDVYGNETGDGAKVIQFSPTDGDNQKFSLRRSKTNVVALTEEFDQLNNMIQRMKTFIELDIFSSLEDRAISHKVYNDATAVYDNKKSTISEVFHATKMVEEQAFLRTGRYYLIGKESGKYILPFGFNDGSKTVLESIRNFTKYEYWQFTRQPGGTYTMEHMNGKDSTFHYLGLNPENTDSSAITVSSGTNADIQKWEIGFDDRNLFVFRNVYSGKYLDVLDGGTADITQVVQETFKNTENQKFILEVSFGYLMKYQDEHSEDRRRTQWIDGLYDTNYNFID